MTVVLGRVRRSRNGSIGCGAGIVLVGLIMLLPLTTVLMAVWPGVMKLTAPLLCPAELEDAVVVRTSSSSPDGGTSTSFTLYCMNGRGEVSDQGAFVPMAIVFAGLVVVVAAVVLAGLVRGALRRRSGDRPGKGDPMIDASSGSLSGPSTGAPASRRTPADPPSRPPT